ncbi:hypothetical protein VTL71DRAFT_10037 [Oculimacula yallundae]|uniref:Heterokaryon incompatibility domain-containing protein n=1 Tax=Oculimacula yallundae TaxID=86028 RepID=A0ABR4BR20_9HELO
MVSPASYPEKEHILPNRGHWNEDGVWISARKGPAVCWCPEGVPPEANLCQRCKDLRLRHVILCESEGRMIDLGKLDAMIKRPECDLCSVFVLGCKQTWRGTDWEDEGIGSQTSVYLNAVEAARQRAGGYRLQISEFHTGKPYQWVEFDLVFRGHGAEIKLVERIVEVCPKVDLDFLRISLKSCEDDHTACKEESLPTPKGMCVIDLYHMSIGPAPQNCRYCALSYVWGQTAEKWLTLTRGNMTLMTEKGALIDTLLPQTVKDAMQLCIDLKERYLWVDSLCIVQDDTVFQRQQINIMDAIYAAATFTIVAAAGNHANTGLPGVNLWPRSVQRQTITVQDIEISNTIPVMKDTVNISVWSTRGWTYQEQIFSNRCMFLTEAQAYFGCNDGVRYERPDRLVAEDWTIGQYKPSQRLKSFMDTYKDHVENYTLRSFTSQGDIMRAFKGVTNHMAGKYIQSFNYALPCENFFDALLWQPAQRTVRIGRDFSFPSRSWTSIIGAIKYSFVEERIKFRAEITELEAPPYDFVREQRIVPTASVPIPAFWEDGKEPELFRVLSTLETESKAVLDSFAKNLGSFPFLTQCVSMLLRNSVPFDYNDNLWTDYTQGVDQTHISIVSILSSPEATEPAGFIELDKIWAAENLRAEDFSRQWSFMAISVAVMRPDDIMNRFFTQRRNMNYPRVWSRNVRELVVNAMLLQWEGPDRDVATRLGVGKIYLDFWEAANPEKKVVILK